MAQRAAKKATITKPAKTKGVALAAKAAATSPKRTASGLSTPAVKKRGK